MRGRDGLGNSSAAVGLFGLGDSLSAHDKTGEDAVMRHSQAMSFHSISVTLDCVAVEEVRREPVSDSLRGAEFRELRRK
jgi:hypothetical protein